MNYIRSISGSVASGWNSINPATLSGAIDVVVVAQEDDSLACSPFHIRFGKFSLLRPYEKKVEFRVNGVKVDYPMKLGEGGEAFFVFETAGNVPEGLQTSPLVSPVQSPELKGRDVPALELAEKNTDEVEELDLGKEVRRKSVEVVDETRKTQSEVGMRLLVGVGDPIKRPLSAADFTEVKSRLRGTLDRTTTDSVLPAAKAAMHTRPLSPLRSRTDRAAVGTNEEARARAMNLSKKLWTSNISNHVTEEGDLMLDMTAFATSDGEALHAEVVARQLLSEEIDGPYDIGALIGADEKGNIWIYGSEEAKEAAASRAQLKIYKSEGGVYGSSDAISDPGYHSDDARSSNDGSLHLRRDSDSAVGMTSPPTSPTAATAGDPNKNYAKTLRLTSDQLKTMDLKQGANTMSFTVNRATCHATLWFWHHSVPIVISDIDGTITKSDVLGHVLNSIGRDWTHQGVAKLYTEIASNGYNFLYLTSRSVGQADMTRAYLKGVVQDSGFKLPGGPVILSPDRTIAALRREVYLRKPELFKMACLRDIMALFSGQGGATNTHEGAEAGLHAHFPVGSGVTPGGLGSGRGRGGSPFYAGFGNRLTDALSYRSVNIPSTRIFTINSNSEVSLDLLSLNTYKTAYGSMREIVDHYFPPVGLLVKGGGEEFTDFNYWREKPLDIGDFDDSESESEELLPKQNVLERMDTVDTRYSGIMSEDEAGDEMLESYLSEARMSLDESLHESLMGEDEEVSESMLKEGEEDGDDEEEEEEEEEEDDEGAGPVTPEVGDGRRLVLEEDTPRAAGGGRLVREPEEID
ncbi:lipin Ned1 [Elasticomyces elasticus]|nr:lipin Ned1 [Elasticomyces elasticus]